MRKTTEEREKYSAINHTRRKLSHPCDMLQAVYSPQFGGEIFFVIIEQHVVVTLSSCVTSECLLCRDSGSLLVVMNHMCQLTFPKSNISEAKSRFEVAAVEIDDLL
jgi:hypothetical protein